MQGMVPLYAGVLQHGETDPLGVVVVFQARHHELYEEPAELTKLRSEPGCVDDIRARVKELREVMVV